MVASPHAEDPVQSMIHGSPSRHVSELDLHSSVPAQLDIVRGTDLWFQSTNNLFSKHMGNGRNSNIHISPAFDDGQAQSESFPQAIVSAVEGCTMNTQKVISKTNAMLLFVRKEKRMFSAKQSQN